MDFLQAIVMSLLSGAFSGAIAWGMQRMEIRYLRRDVDELRRVVLKTL